LRTFSPSEIECMSLSHGQIKATITYAAHPFGQTD
jgi:hypothetical protein